MRSFTLTNRNRQNLQGSPRFPGNQKSCRSITGFAIPLRRSTRYHDGLPCAFTKFRPVGWLWEHRFAGPKKGTD